MSINLTQKLNNVSVLNRIVSNALDQMKIFLQFTSCILVIISFVFLNSCNKKISRLETRDSKLQIVTTFSPLYSLTANIAREKANIENIVPPGSSIHTFELKPSDIKKIANADILVTNGLGLENFLNNAIEASNNKDLIIVNTSKNIEAIKQDPHVWLKITNAILQTNEIKKAFIEKDPKNKDYYEKNYLDYEKKLLSLDNEIREKFSKTEKKDFIVFHDALQYYLRDFDLLTYRKASIEEFPGKEPSEKYINELVNLIKNDKVKIIFTEPYFSPKIVDILRNELNIKTYEIGPDNTELTTEGYEKNMQNITDTFIKAFNN